MLSKPEVMIGSNYLGKFKDGELIDEQGKAALKAQAEAFAEYIEFI